MLLNDHQSELLELLQYPQYSWEVKLPEQLKQHLRNVQAKHNNINEQAEQFLINCIKNLKNDPDYINYLSIDSFWKTAEYLDIIADYISLTNNPVTRTVAEDNLIEDIKHRLKNFINDKISIIGNDNSFNYLQIKPGKFLKKLFPDANAQECEDFQQAWKTYYKKWSWESVIETHEICKYYHVNQYSSESGTLGSSCMRGSRQLKFMKFYEVNNLRMAIFPDPENPNKIRARALLWDVYLPDSQEKTRYNLPDRLTFMDRKYFLTEEDKMLLEVYASKKQYYRKAVDRPSWQGMISPDGNRIDENVTMHFALQHIQQPFPYIDTFKSLVTINGELLLTNNSNGNSQAMFESTDGGYDGHIPASQQNNFNRFKCYVPETDSYISSEEYHVCSHCYSSLINDSCNCNSNA